MKRNNKKGFTIVELVIVIAVISILAGILIPTFAGVVGNAEDAAAKQQARSVYNAYLVANNGVDIPAVADEDDGYIKVSVNNEDAWFSVEGGKLDKLNGEPNHDGYTSSDVTGGTVYAKVN